MSGDLLHAVMDGDRTHRTLPILGDHMEPTFRRGDHVLLDVTTTRYIGEGFYVLEMGGRPCVYRAGSPLAPGRPIKLISDNQRYSVQEISLEYFNEQCLGRVIAFARVLDQCAMARLATGGAS